MPLFLRHRNPRLVELMDEADCDPVKLQNTYRNFRTINKLLSKWVYLYKHEIKPLAEKNRGSITLLDIGFGGGDIPVLLEDLARNDGIELQITAIETDPRALNYVQQFENRYNIQFIEASTEDLVRQEKQFDIVISNHLIHHLMDDELLKLLDEADQLSRHKVLFNDIERSDLGYILFMKLAWIWTFNSFIWKDGLLSIRRSFTSKELSALVPSGWQVRRLFPFRLMITKYKNG